MSRPTLETIKMLMEEAGEIFDDEQDFPVPPDPNPPVTDKVKLRTFQSLVTRLDISHDESERVMLGLRNCLSNLHDIRVKMTEKERTADNVIYDDFLDNNDYVGPMKQLAKYCKKLKLQKRALLDKIEELEDSLAAAATPAIPRRSGVAVSLPNPVPDPTHVEPSLHSPELPKFDGDISNWLTFWSHFKYLVHDSKRLPPALKLKFLIDSCKGGPAQNLVDVFELKDEYYPLALSRLKERFNNTEEVKDALDHKLTVLAPMDGSLDDLSRFIDELENIFMRMEALGEPIDTRHIRALVIKKVPGYLMEKLHSSERQASQNNEQWTTNKMREFLKEHLALKQRTSRSLAEARAEYTETPKRPPMFQPRGLQFPTPGDPPNFQSSQSQSTATLFCTGAQNRHRSDSFSLSGFEQAKLPQPCLFCTSLEHRSTFCPLDIDGRRASLKSQRLCYKCLQIGHMARQCNKTCELCCLSHHKLICPKIWSRNKNISFSNSSPSQTPHTQVTSAFVLSIDTSKPPPGFGNHVHRQEIPPPPGFETKICDQYVLNSKSDFPIVSQFSDKNDSNVNSVCPENSEFVDSVPDHELDLSESGLFDFETTQKADLDGFIEDSYIGELYPEFQENVILDFENLPSSQLFCTDNFEVDPSNSEPLIFPNLNLKINFHSWYYTITYTGISESTSRILKFELNNNVLLSLGTFHNPFPPIFKGHEIIHFPESQVGPNPLTNRIFVRICKSRSKAYYCLFSGFLPPDTVRFLLYFRNSESDISQHSICNVSPIRAVMMAQTMPDFVPWMCPMPRFSMPNAPYALQQARLEPSIVNQSFRKLHRAISNMPAAHREV